MHDVVALGEVLIDFTPMGESENGNQIFERNPGGAPANVLATVAKLGKSTAFIGMVGKDQFGVFLKDVLENSGIDTKGLVLSEEVNTTLAFVHLSEKGDRSFSFYRNPGADMMLKEDDINFEIIQNSKIFHFGSISLTHEPARSATLAAIKYAKKNSVIVSYDPNLRPLLWSNLNDAKEKIKFGLKYADVLKVSEDELNFITGEKDLAQGTAILYMLGVSVIFVTLGPGGCFYRYKGGNGLINTYNTKVVDTTGSGDGFLGGVLYKLSDMTLGQINYLEKEEFESIIGFGNAVGSLVATKKGAIPAIPTLEDVIQCQKYVPLLRV